MSLRLKKPIDKYTAEETLKKFPDMAYSLVHKDIFEEAVSQVYGREFVIKADLSKRMLFHCEMCNKDMNSVEALESHCRSGTHHKNKDKKDRETFGTSSWTGSTNFHQDSLQYRVMTCSANPIGLQMVEEYIRGGGHSYYKCILCGAHGKLDQMYKHIIGKKHTEKYIKSSYSLLNAALTPKERDHLHEQLVKEEGVNGSLIRTVTGHQYYPDKFEAEGRNWTKAQSKFKEEVRTPSPPSHGSSNRPCSSSSKRSGRRSPRTNSPMSGFRNMSPPPPPLRPLSPSQPPLPPPLPSQIQAPVPSASPVETIDKATQKCDLEELMTQFNFIVKSHPMTESDVKTEEDAKAVIDIMFKIADTLHFITKSELENTSYKENKFVEKLLDQKRDLEKIMGSVKERMAQAWRQQNVNP